jgi:hypothetical protein
MSAAHTTHFDCTYLTRLADWLAVAVAVSLPWSTTAVGITIAAWLIVLLPTLDAAAVRRELGTTAGGLPVVLWSLGLIGMWIAHLALFRGESVVAWLGLVVVVENILSSTVHSHLFDFNSGWLYVFGIGVLGGTMLRECEGDLKKPPIASA